MEIVSLANNQKTNIHAKKVSSKNKKLITMIIVFFFLFLFFTAVLGDNGLLRLYQMSETKRELVEQITKIKEENQELQKKIYAFKNDPLYIEKIAREELGLLKPGEIVYDFKGIKENQRKK